MPTAQMWRLRLRGGKELVQVYMAGEQQSLALNDTSVTMEPTLSHSPTRCHQSPEHNSELQS